MTKETTIMQDINRLTEIKNELMGQNPDLDKLMPKFEETIAIEKKLKEFFSSRKKLIAEKRKERESE